MSKFNLKNVFDEFKKYNILCNLDNSYIYTDGNEKNLQIHDNENCIACIYSKSDYMKVLNL